PLRRRYEGSSGPRIGEPVSELRRRDLADDQISRSFERRLGGGRERGPRGECRVETSARNEPNRLAGVVDRGAAVRVGEGADLAPGPVAERLSAADDLFTLLGRRGAREDRMARGMRADFDALLLRERGDLG